MSAVAATKDILAALVAEMPSGSVLTAPDQLAPYSLDWSQEHFGMPLAVALPGSVAEVARLLRLCNANRIPVVPQGGLTGLVGAAVAEPGGREVVVSLERMNKIRSVSPLDFAMVVDAGCVLDDAKRAAEAVDCILPITFSAQDTCRIGGNVATNAGGFNVLRYGMTRDLVLGLEVVLGDGRIWNGLKLLRKDNRGYDLKQLFIGSEGTLGIVTGAALKLFPRPTQVETALVGLRSLEDAMALYARARHECSDLLTAFELLMRVGIDIAVGSSPELGALIPADCPVYVLLEVSAAGRVDLRGLVQGFLDGSEDLVVAANAATDQAQAERLWSIRKEMVYTQGRGGRYLRTDVSVPVSKIADFIHAALAVLSAAHPNALAVTYGHVGDGNIHLNVVPPPGMASDEVEALFHAAEARIFEVIDRFDGSLSAEHGIGRAKQKAFLQRIDPVSLDLAERIRDAFDPGGIMSNGRILAPRTVERGGAWR